MIRRNSPASVQLFPTSTSAEREQKCSEHLVAFESSTATNEGLMKKEYDRTGKGSDYSNHGTP